MGKMTEDSSLVPAVRRAGAILSALVASNGRPVSISELARQLRLPKSSTANLCLALEAERMVTRVDGGYRLGRRLVELGGAYLSTVDQVQEFYSTCRQQPQVSQLTARVAVLEGTDVLYLARYDGTQPIRLTANIGDRFPAHCTATGKALLARVDPAAVSERYRGQRRLITLTDKSIATVAELRDELEQVRRSGYAVDDEETTQGVTCLAIAVPGFRTDSEPFAISVTSMTSQLDEALRSVLLKELREIGQAMSNPMVSIGA